MRNQGKEGNVSFYFVNNASLSVDMANNMFVL